MSLVRTAVGIGLAVGVLLCFYFQYISFLYLLVNLAAIYDGTYLYFRLHINMSHVLAFLLAVSSFHLYLFRFYLADPLSVIKILAITQVSDVYQYVAGSRCGISKIGWISRHKSYEGYIFGFVATMATFLPAYLLLSFNGIIPTTTVYTAIYEITMIYLLGVASSLLSSLFKRMENIKDYSDMLGPHGGWVDRIDSIILPLIAEAMSAAPPVGYASAAEAASG